MGLVSNAFSFRHTHVESNVDYLRAVSVQAAEEPRMENCLPNPSLPSIEDICALRDAVSDLKAVMDETMADIRERRHNLVALNDKVSLIGKRILLERYCRLRVMSRIGYRGLDGAKDSSGLSGGGGGGLGAGASGPHRSVKFANAGASTREQLEAQWRRRSAKR
jgi:hypothetical protein